MSIDSIVKRLRESRISEASESYEYKFDIPWRECVEFGDDFMTHYKVSQMDYAAEIMDTAKEDFNSEDWQNYASEDSRTEDCGILSMVMDFDAKGSCILTVTTSVVLDDEQIEAVKEFLTGQMSDGWGEGFEQRVIATFKDEVEEWVEDEDTGEGFYEYVPTTAYVFGQFWWSDSIHNWDISLLSTPLDKGMPTNESANDRVTPELMDISSEIHQAVEKEVIKYMKSEGFSEDEVKDYTRVDATFQEDNLVIEVGAEVSYDGLMDLCDKLNPIVAHYDKDSYFEPITSGIIGAWISIDALDSLEESTDNHKAEYVCKKVLCDKDGVIEILCYDTVEDEEFEKYIGQVDSPSARKSASLLLRDWKFEVPKEIKNELIGTFGLEDFGYSIEESTIEDYCISTVTVEENHGKEVIEKERFHFNSKEEADRRYEEMKTSGMYDEVNKEY